MAHSGKSLGKVLCLNANYTPLTIMSVEHAVVLLWLNKVELVIARDDKMLRSAYETMPFPSVVRVKQFAVVPFKKVPLTKRNILRRDDYTCQYCGSHDDLTLDHVQPKSRGGLDSWTNLVACCRRCNNAKNDQALEEAGLTLLRKPHRPHHIAFLKAVSKEGMASWEPFLFQ